MIKSGNEFTIQAGDFLPADAVLLTAERLEIDEFELTGELLPATKQVGERVWAGTTVVAGQGIAQAVAVGEDSEYGRILAARAEARARSLENWRQSWLVSLRRMMPVQFLLILLFISNEGMVLRPESAPLLLWVLVAVQILGWREMWRFMMLKWLRRNICRAGLRLMNPAVVEALGEIQTCCFDKTGILTTRQMTVVNVASPSPESGRSNVIPTDSVLFRRLIQGCAFGHQLRDDSRSGQRPIDDALQEFSKTHLPAEWIAVEGVDRRVELPFVAENRCSIVSAIVQGKRRTWLKGAPEAVLSRCRFKTLASGEVIAISGDFLLAVRQSAIEYFAHGRTVIAMAERCPAAMAAQPDNYCFLGLIILANPLRPEAVTVIHALAKLQVRSLIVTGDTPASAAFAATSLGIAGPEAPVLSGVMLAKMSLADISDQSGHVSIFARVTPSQKGLVVEALKRRGRSVMFVGDGANDAIALRRADAGISLQRESSIFARSNADLLINDDLRALPRLIHSGRRFRKWQTRRQLLHWAGIAAITAMQFLRHWPESFAVAGVVLIGEIAAAAWIVGPIQGVGSDIRQ